MIIYTIKKLYLNISKEKRNEYMKKHRHYKQNYTLRRNKMVKNKY